MGYKFNPFTGKLDDVGSSVVNTDEKAKVSANDTTAGYLNGKLVAGANITLTENNDGANETLTISSTGGGTASVEFKRHFLLMGA
jgi:hypothetical protein